MVIHMNGSAEELLYFVKGLQLPAAEEVSIETEVEIEEEIEVDDRNEIENEVERLFTEVEKQTKEHTKLRTVMIELNLVDWVVLHAMAEVRSMRGCELAAEIITDWLNRQKYLRK